LPRERTTPKASALWPAVHTDHEGKEYIQAKSGIAFDMEPQEALRLAYKLIGIVLKSSVKKVKVRIWRENQSIAVFGYKEDEVAPELPGNSDETPVEVWEGF
jgi:hypothetical protein